MSTRDIGETQYSNPNEFNNPSSYKKTTKKQHRIYVCMPKIGSKVSNKLNLKQFVVDEEQNRYVVCGTAGENYTTNLQELTKNYNFSTGEPVNAQAIAKKSILINSKGDTRPVGDKLIPERILYEKKVVCLMDWVQMVSKPYKISTYWACFVPKYYSFTINDIWGNPMQVNDSRTIHGAGDFIVCPDVNGRPNLNNRIIINGEIFPALYDMRAFPNIGNLDRKIEQPKSIIKIVKQAKPVKAETPKVKVADNIEPPKNSTADSKDKYAKERDTFSKLSSIIKDNIDKKVKVTNFIIKIDEVADKSIGQSLLRTDVTSNGVKIAVKLSLENSDGKLELVCKIADEKKVIDSGNFEFSNKGASELAKRICKNL